MKKLVASILLMVMISTSVYAVNFSDVKDQDWHYSYVMGLTERGIINGYPDGTFMPKATIKVDEFIKLAIVALGHELENGEGYWASTYIDKALEIGLITPGQFDTTKRPILREEMADIIINAYEMKAEIVSDSRDNIVAAYLLDITEAKDRYEETIIKAYRSGFINGKRAGYFDPKDKATRAEASVMIMRLLEDKYRDPFDFTGIDPKAYGLTPTGETYSERLERVKAETAYLDDYIQYDPIQDTESYPNLNEHFNRVAHAMAHYTEYVYSMEHPNDVKSFLSYKYGPHFNFQQSFFNVGFYPNGFNLDEADWDKGFSSNIQVEFQLNQLIWDAENESDVYRHTEDDIRNAFRDSIIAVLGPEEGLWIFDYMMDYYLEYKLGTYEIIERDGYTLNMFQDFGKTIVLLEFK